MGSPRKSFYVITLVFSAALTLLFIELCLAIFYPVPYSIERNMYFEADQNTGYRLRPNGVGHFQHGIAANANSHGHRDDEVNVSKRPDVFRIIMLGDSFTVGAGVT